MVSEGLAQGIYGGLAYAGQQDPSLLPSGYASAYQNGTDIIQTLFLTCNASSGAPQLIAESIASPGRELTSLHAMHVLSVIWCWKSVAKL